jgi:hypothetical protein
MSVLNIPLENKISCFRIQYDVKKIKEAVHDEILFDSLQNGYCMGIVDMVNSTKITAYLEHNNQCAVTYTSSTVGTG